MTKRSKPIIGITLGDPAGIGPEIAVQAATSPKVRRCCRPVLLGDARVVERAARTVGCEWRIVLLGPGWEIRQTLPEIQGRRLAVLELGGANPKQISSGRLSARAGRAAYEWVAAGARLALTGSIDALVTAPLNKKAVARSGVKGFQGHTEMLAELSGTRRFAMMLAGGNLRVVLVTTHVALSRVAKTLSAKAVCEKIELTHEFLRRIGKRRPRIAVAALNPHAGEGGLLGDKEQRVIRPAIARAKRKGITVLGPLPADTLFARHLKEPYDAIVVMYHDQGLIPLKMLSFGKGVNITLGLPFVRTSPDHGTAFDLAGMGAADPGSMIEAVCTAARLCS